MAMAMAGVFPKSALQMWHGCHIEIYGNIKYVAVEETRYEYI